MESLSLYSNRISCVTPGAFDSLVSLRALNLISKEKKITLTNCLLQYPEVAAENSPSLGPPRERCGAQPLTMIQHRTRTRLAATPVNEFPLDTAPPSYPQITSPPREHEMLFGARQAPTQESAPFNACLLAAVPRPAFIRRQYSSCRRT